MENEQKLPDRLSDLIRVALADLRKVEKSKRYVVDMTRWHANEENEEGALRCHVCLAGAVMAKTLGIRADCNTNPDLIDPFSRDVRKKLLALDEVRKGNVSAALYLLDPRASLPAVIDGWQEAPPYVHSSKAFHKYLGDLADQLQAAGL